MNISQAAKNAGLPVKTVRYYADIDLVAPSGRTESGYRDFDERSVKMLTFVKRSRDFGFSIEECRELLDLYQNQDRSSADVKRLASLRLEQIRAKQIELQQLHDELAHLVSSCRGDDRPHCPILNHLG